MNRACDHIHRREENWCLCHGHLVRHKDASKTWLGWVEITLLNTNPQLRQKPCWLEGCEYYIVFDPWISKYSGDHHHTGKPKYLRVFQLRDVKTEWNSRGGYPLVKFNIAIKYPHVQKEIHLPTVDFPASYNDSYTGKIYHINWLLRGNYEASTGDEMGHWLP